MTHLFVVHVPKLKSKSFKDMLRKVVKKIYDDDGVCTFSISKVFQVEVQSEMDELSTWFNSVVSDAKFMSRGKRLYVSFELSDPEKELSLFDDVY